MNIAHILKRPTRVYRADFDTPGAYASGTAFGDFVLTCVRAGDATYKDAAGVWQAASANQIRVGPRGLLVEPARTQFYPTPAAPAAGTTGSLATGTWTFWVEGTGSQAISAGTAVGTGWGTASAGSPVTVTITSAGTATLAAVTGSLDRAQIESGAFPTSFIATAGATRAADVISAPSPLKAGALFTVSVTATPLWKTPAGITTSPMVTIGTFGQANAASLYVNSSNQALWAVWDSPAVFKVITGAVGSIPTNDYTRARFTGRASGGTLTMWRNFATNGTASGSGTGVIAAAPSTLYIGSGGSNYYSGFLSALKIVQADRSAAFTSPDSASILAIGDSITAGQGLAASYPLTVSRTLGGQRVCHNAATSGYTTAQMLTAYQAQPGGSGTLILMGGINDINASVAVATIEANLQAIIDAARAAGMRVVVLTVLPAGGSASWSAPKETNRDTLNTWIAGYCVTSGSTCVDAAADFEDGSTGNMKAAYDSGDHLHPNQAGADRLAALVSAALAP